MADDYVRRTAITRLSVDDEQRELLEETISEWLHESSRPTRQMAAATLLADGETSRPV